MATKTKQITNSEGTFTVKVGSSLDRANDAAIAKNAGKIGSSFTGAVPTGLTPQQQSAYAGVQSAFGAPTYTPYASDSSSVVAGENKTTSDLQSYLQQTPDIKNFMQTSLGSIADIDKYIAQLNAQGQADTAGIKDRYASARTDTIEAQGKETASMNTALTTRLGGYLGGSASHVGALQNLSQTHKTELLKLDAQRDAAIQAAQNALTDKNFQLARLKADEIKGMSQEIYKRQQDFFQNALALSSEKRQLGKDYKDYLETLSAVAGEGQELNLDPAKAQEIDTHFGVPGFTQQYMQAAQSSAAAKTQKERIESMKSYMDLLESIPEGVQVPFGDDVVTGIGKTSDISTYQVEDAAGNVRILAYNKRTGTTSITSAGAIGTPSSAGSSESAANLLSQFANKFRADQVTTLQDGQTIPVLDENQNVNPLAWKQAIASAAAHKITRGDFIKQYGYLLYAPDGEVSSEYGLTPQEKKLIYSL